MSKTLDSMMCENETYKKKHVPAKRVGKAVPPAKPVEEKK